MDSNTKHSLFGIWGAAPDDVWAVGGSVYIDNPDKCDGVVLHWDGVEWKEVQYSSEGRLFDLWGTDSNDIWVVGGMYSFQNRTSTGLVMHWDGKAWSVAHRVEGSRLLSIWGTSTDNVWAVGEGLTLHWNGSSWTTVEEMTHKLTFIRGIAPNDIVAVGDSFVVVHWDGTTWSTLKEPGCLWQCGYSGVWAFSSDDVWCVGGEEINEGQTIGIINRWKGSEIGWGYPGHGTEKILNGVWGLIPDDVWVFGRSGKIHHWDGIAFSETSTGTNVSISGVWGMDDQFWAVGGEGTILQFKRE